MFVVVCCRINYSYKKYIFAAMIRLLSYIYPITKKVKSNFNGTLEITWHNGKKHLNTKNANYSYGSLQEILKYGLEKIDLNDVNSVLLLGLGGGSVIETLNKDFGYKNKITAVDIDSSIIDVAKTEFNIKNNQNLKIICTDALQFMNQNSKQYDLIIIDLFIDTSMPEQFLDTSFWQHITNSNTKKGSILFNASLENEKENKLYDVINFLNRETYKVDIYNNVNKTNTLMIANTL